jgi:hypothetical protein
VISGNGTVEVVEVDVELDNVVVLDDVEVVAAMVV